eukprot:5873208-Lingulodinium_polyedra.AAC.1
MQSRLGNADQGGQPPSFAAWLHAGVAPAPGTQHSGVHRQCLRRGLHHGRLRPRAGRSAFQFAEYESMKTICTR